MKEYIVFEVQSLIKSKKSWAVFLMLLIATIVFSVQQRSYRPIERVEKAEIEQRYLSRQEFLDAHQEEEQDWSAAYAKMIFTPWNKAEKARLDALNAQDWPAYAKASSEWYQIGLQFTDSENLFFTPDYYTYQNYYAKYDGKYGYAQTAKWLEGLSKLPEKQLSQAVMEQKTGLQALQRAFTSFLPFLLMVAAIFLAIDLVTKDRHHKSLFLSLPLSVDQVVWSKTIAFMAIMMSAAVLTAVLIVVLVGVQFGFGSLQLPVSILSAAFDARYPIESISAFELEPIWLFLLKNIGCAFFFMFLYVRFIMLLSMVFRSELVNFFLCIFAVITPFIFQRRWFSSFIDRSAAVYLYQDYGKILSGYSRFYFGSEKFVMIKGLFLFSCIWLVIELLLAWLIHRPKFRIVV